MSKSKEKDQKNKKGKGFFIIIIFILFFAVGAAGGILGTKIYFELNKEEVVEEDIIISKEKDITTKTEYQDTISNLHNYIKNYADFYNSKGLDVHTMDGSIKFKMIYDMISLENLSTTEVFNTTYYGSGYCDYGFLADNLNQGVPSTICTLQKYNKSDFLNKYNSMFANSDFNLDVEYYPVDNKKCTPIGEYIYCGNVDSLTGVIGELKPRFTVNKVMMDDEHIYIYDKGYLIDSRSTVPYVEGESNYYLHAADSSEHYHELKSADNLTFKHTYRLQNDGKYYYLKTELVTK